MVPPSESSCSARMGIALRQTSSTQVSIFVIMLIEDPGKRGGDQLEFCHL